MDKTENDFVTIKIRLSSRRKLRLIAAQADEKIIDIVDRLASKELERVKKTI